MKFFIESTWAPWEPFPATIDDWYQVTGQKSLKGHADLMDLPQFKTAIENGDLFFNQRSEHDYLVHNTDGTKSIGFWQPKRDIAQEWVNHCQSRMRAGQIEHILVARPEAGDDANSAVMSYSERLDAGLIPPYSVT